MHGNTHINLNRKIKGKECGHGGGGERRKLVRVASSTSSAGSEEMNLSSAQIHVRALEWTILLRPSTTESKL